MPHKCDPDESAFPKPEDESSERAWGCTKREYFAALALQGLLANEGTLWQGSDNYHRVLKGTAMAAVEAADALIESLNTKE